MLWYLSFADPNKPRGSQWLGAIVVEAIGFTQALAWTHHLGINPGGQVKGYPYTGVIGPEFRDRLLDMTDIEALDFANGGKGESQRF